MILTCPGPTCRCRQQDDLGRESHEGIGTARGVRRGDQNVMHAHAHAANGNVDTVIAVHVDGESSLDEWENLLPFVKTGGETPSACGEGQSRGCSEGGHLKPRGEE
jgi:hypothetical protein